MNKYYSLNVDLKLGSTDTGLINFDVINIMIYLYDNDISDDKRKLYKTCRHTQG